MMRHWIGSDGARLPAANVQDRSRRRGVSWGVQKSAPSGRFMKGRGFLLILLALSGRGLAWENHALLTRAAFKDLPQLDVPVESLETFAAATGLAGDVGGALAGLRINPELELAFKAGESPGGMISLGEVLAVYSDEPDWGMDQNLLAHYPDLWADDYDAMGGRANPKTLKVARHAYWPAGFMKLTGFLRVPTYKSQPLGEAPERAQFFFDRSREAFLRGHPYWGARFLAWSLHYLQDAAQPYHTVQLPSWSMLVWRKGRIDHDLTERLVSYYHYAFEALAARALSGGLGPGIREGFLSETSGVSTMDPAASPRELTRRMAAGAHALASDAVRWSMDLFPGAGDPERLDPERRILEPEFWHQMERIQKRKSESHAELMGVLRALFRELGRVSRTLAAQALPPPQPRKGILSPQSKERLSARLQDTAAALLGTAVPTVSSPHPYPLPNGKPDFPSGFPLALPVSGAKSGSLLRPKPHDIRPGPW